MKLKLLSSIVILTLTQAAFAGQEDKPQSCPTISAVTNIGITKLIHTEGDTNWTGYIGKNTFGTNEEWTFMIQGIQASDASDALAKINSGVATLYSWGEPQYDRGEWGCVYTNAKPDDDNPPDTNPIMGVALTPPLPLEDIRHAATFIPKH